jgi:hypothetical protein
MFVVSHNNNNNLKQQQQEKKNNLKGKKKICRCLQYQQSECSAPIQVNQCTEVSFRDIKKRSVLLPADLYRSYCS